MSRCNQSNQPNGTLHPSVLATLETTRTWVVAGATELANTTAHEQRLMLMGFLIGLKAASRLK
jgi:hypothetical protein